MSQYNLLVVDDDELILGSIALSLPACWKLTSCSDAKYIPQGNYHVAMVDMHLTGDISRAEGVEVVKKIHAINCRTEIIAMSGNLDRELMESCLKAGASRFLAKPLNAEEIALILGKIEAWLLLQRVASKNNHLSQKWIGTGYESQEIKRSIAALHGEKGPILLEGESGTGKEVAAHLIYEQASDGPFVRVNVAAIPESLFESEFFGHVRGAFTGADQNKMGLAEAAHGGTLFLDEVEALPITQQVKLLRFLESGEIRRVGAKETTKIDTRVIVATNRSLDAMVEAGEFREDLLWRISGKKIKLTPLRDRLDDIEALCRHFFSMDSRRQKSISKDAIEALQNHDWPGNVRELKRVCEHLILHAPLPLIRKDDLVGILKPQFLGKKESWENFTLGLPTLLRTYESDLIQKCMMKYNKNVEDVANILKISRSSLYKKFKDHNLDWR